MVLVRVYMILSVRIGMLVRVAVLVQMSVRMSVAVSFPRRMRVLVRMRMGVLMPVRMAFMRVVTMRMLRVQAFGTDHIHPGRRQPSAHDLARLNPRAHIQSRSSLFEGGHGNAGIDHRAQQHVPADAGKTIQVGNTHRG